MRVLGLDLGASRVGVAVGDTSTLVASPTEVLHRDRITSLADGVRRCVREWEAELVVVGLPRSLDGTEGPAAQGVRDEVALLCAVLDVPVEVHDERFSTVTAQRSLHAAGLNSRRGRKVIDAIAASVILQSWLDTWAEDPR